MKRTELILAIIAIIGIILKILHLPGATMLLTLSFTFLSILYYIFSFALFNNLELKNIFKKKPTKVLNHKKL